MSVTTPKRRPKPPDMLPNGTADQPTLRASKYRNVTQFPQDRVTEPIVKRHSKLVRLIRFLFGPALPFMGIVFLFLCGWYLFSTIVSPWWSGIQDQWNYGGAKITQVDKNVGHKGMSHFVAEYYKGSIVVIELSLTDQSDSHIYTINGLEGENQQPVILLSFADENHDGKIDMIISIKDTNFSAILYNNGTTFQDNEPGSN